MSKSTEPQRQMCHVRLPIALHERLRQQAFDERVSINRLIARLLEQALDGGQVALSLGSAVEYQQRTERRRLTT